MRGRASGRRSRLGKTIEAGIIMKELIQRGLVRTVLVLTPASLTEHGRNCRPSSTRSSPSSRSPPRQALANAEASAAGSSA